MENGLLKHAVKHLATFTLLCGIPISLTFAWSQKIRVATVAMHALRLVMSHALEGASIFYHSGYYYLFASLDNGCSASVNYHIAVGRTTSVTDSYTDEERDHLKLLPLAISNLQPS